MSANAETGAPPIGGVGGRKETTSISPPKAPRRRLLLGGSLALNAFLLALVAGYFMIAQKPNMTPEMRAMTVALKSAPEELREDAFFVRDRTRLENTARIEAITAALQELAMAAKADPFSANTFLTALERLRSARSRAWTKRHDALVDIMAKADPATRQRFALEMAGILLRREERIDQMYREIDKKFEESAREALSEG